MPGTTTARAALDVGASGCSCEVVEADRRELVANTAHDLRTPLTCIRVIADALADDLLADPELRRVYLESLRANVVRMSGLVDAWSEMSQPETVLLTRRRESVRIGDLVLDLLLRFHPYAAAAGVRLEADVGDGDVTARAEPGQVSSILNNLVQNGLRHTPPGAAVTVRVEQDASTTLVRVQDACGGIPDEDVDRLFDRHWRGDQAVATAGSGLGLTIASALAKRLGGRLSVSNKEPGCEFRLELPQLAGAGRRREPRGGIGVQSVADPPHRLQQGRP